MKIELKKLSDLKPAPYNPRQSNAEQENQLKSSLEKFGVVEPIIFNKQTGFIVGGHFRIRELKKLGYKEIECVIVDLNEADEKELNIRLNANTGSWDWDELANNWDSELLSDWGLEIPGFEPTILEAEEDDFTAPEGGIETDIVLGDLFEIGEHRLLCGDSTDSDAVAKLMDGKKADMVFTDPPYGMSYKGTTFGKEGIENDGDDEWENVLKGSFQNMILFSNNSVFALCFSPSRLDRFFKCTEGINFKRILTIYKPNRMGYPWQSWILTSEIIALFENGKPEYIKENYKHDVYTFDYSERPDKEINHPTVKPLSIVGDVISKTKGESVLDLFLGSGTTMVASHQLKRKCYGMELDPKYCQVIIDRMKKLEPSIKIKRNGIELK
jgi:DNA modification methylase